MSKVPPGSLWEVLPFISPSVRRQVVLPGMNLEQFTATVPGWGAPQNTWTSPQDRIEFQVGDLLLVGDTFPDETGKSGGEWVQIFTPVQCFVNRTHFNPDSEYLRRVV